MRTLRCLSLILVMTLVGCSSSTGPDKDNNSGNNGNTNEPVEYDLTVSPNPDQGGSVDPSSGTYEEGSEVTVAATAQRGWNFTGWSGDQSSDENPFTFTINEDTELKANFESHLSKYRISITLNNGIRPESFFYFNFGQVQGASRGYDKHYDQKAPPPPPDGAFHAYFEIDDLELFNDIRSDTSTQTEWKLNYQINKDDDLVLKWEVADHKQADGSLILTDKARSFKTDMFSQTSDTISGTSKGTLFINYSLDQ